MACAVFFRASFGSDYDISSNRFAEKTASFNALIMFARSLAPCSICIVCQLQKFLLNVRRLIGKFRAADRAKYSNNNGWI